MDHAGPSYNPLHRGPVHRGPAEFDPVKQRRPPDDLLERRGDDPRAETSGAPIGWRTFLAPLVVALGAAILAFSALGLVFREVEGPPVGHLVGLAAGACWIAAGVTMWRRQLVLTLIATAAGLLAAVIAQTLVR